MLRKGSYYHAKKRSPTEYLHRHNVAGIRAKLQIKDDTATTRREHVEHLIQTLDDHNLVHQLALILLTNAKDPEGILRARQGKADAGSNQFRQKTTPEN
ncbi:hypothetical protein PHMEG_00014025 [Phytophthora megakarya]|uniref:Uncharacterized protein n=1 Tax=Phytophthora megakarya TaxID=4795 RepID=A0A225W7E4_9STRA|nr:hypothetical protein PHMEG_00014025 [Phytophthora megakarya]